jgi:ribosomal protein S18 acetylase RimI-like enzyme
MFDSMRSFWCAFARASRRGSALELPGVTAAITPALADRSVANGVVYDDVAALEAAHDQLAAAYDEAGVRAWTVWVDSLDDDAQRALEARGHVLDAAPMGQELELDGIERPADGELDLVEAPGPADLDPVVTAAYGWSGFGDAVEAFPQGFHPYLARRDGVPASCLGIWDWHGDAHVQMVGTIPEARGHGLASRLLRLALVDARDRGCTVSRLQATAMGAPVYRGIGYRDLRPVQMWERRKPAAAE